METRQEVKTYSVHYICDKCGNGEMFPTGISLTLMPPKYPHYCKCGHVDTFSKIYPATEFEQIP